MSYPSQQLSTTPPRQLSEAELQARYQQSFPEARGPGVDTESGAVLYGQPPHPRIGPVPVMAGASRQDREREDAERQQREAAVPPEIRAARDLLAAEMRQQQVRRAF